MLFIVGLMLAININFAQSEVNTKQKTMTDSSTLNINSNISVQFQDRITKSDYKAYNEMLKYITSQQKVDVATENVLIEVANILPFVGIAIENRHKTYYSKMQYLESIGISSDTYRTAYQKHNGKLKTGYNIVAIVTFACIVSLLIMLIQRYDWRAIIFTSVAFTLLCYILWMILPLTMTLNSEYNVIQSFL